MDIAGKIVTFIKKAKEVIRKSFLFAMEASGNNIKVSNPNPEGEKKFMDGIKKSLGA